MSARRSSLAALSGMAVCLFLQVDAATPAGPLAGFDADVARAVADWRAPGLAIAVVKDGQVVFSKGYGVRELGRPEPVDTHTLFAIGSTTKAMTAALVGMMVEEKKLGWDDKVIQHLPWFRVKDPYLTREITVRDLLTHRAGLGSVDYLWYGQTNSSREILERLRLVEPSYSLRSSFVYQNVMYAAAGAVLEAVSGQSWAEMIRSRIFDPLGMTESIATAATLALQPNVARPHDVVDGQLQVITNLSVDAVAPAGAIWSSVNDMSKWTQLLLDGGKTSTGVLLRPDTVRELFTPQTMVPVDEFYPTAALTRPHWTTYGLGWFQQDYRGHAVDYHTGSIDGMVAIHGLIRDQRLGVYILANGDHAELRHALMWNVFDRFSGAGGRDWSAELLKLYAGRRAEADAKQQAEADRRVAKTSPSLPLARYEGTYSDPLHGEIVVTLAAGRLHARYGTAFDGVLDHWHYDTFRAKWDKAWHGTALLTFALDEDGQPSSLDGFGARFARSAEKK
jgi:CubicO group peptidase (beta-lactamase class C family)